jgi:Holliday junction resolvase-like predicted endonuclease
MRTPRQQTGDAAESSIAQRLTASGWTIVARNVRVGRRELDLLAIDPGPPRTLVVVEVRRRAGRSFGLPEETFGWRKRRDVRSAAFGLIARGQLPDGRPLPRLPLRFDLVLVEPSSDPGGADLVRHHRHVVGY